jgi:hypothetical protein
MREDDFGIRDDERSGEVVAGGGGSALFFGILEEGAVDGGIGVSVHVEDAEDGSAADDAPASDMDHHGAAPQPFMRIGMTK